MDFICSLSHIRIEEPPRLWPPLTEEQLFAYRGRTINFTCEEEVTTKKTKLKILKEGISCLQIFEKMSNGTDICKYLVRSGELG